MGSITIRNIDDQLKARLRIAAATNGRSMEEEVRVILKTALSTDVPQEASLYDAIRAHVEPIGGIELTLPEREPIRTPENLL
ncbi:MAG: plasmid stability protein [Lautropia sp.]|nr:plasmid stability protein [Lautropia sp.]